MKFLEALNYCHETGKSITKSRYSDSAKDSFQWYFVGDQLVLQEDSNKPRCSNIGKDYWTDDYIPYNGPYEQWTTQQKQNLERYNILKKELEPFLSKYEEFKKLESKLGELNGTRIQF